MEKKDKIILQNTTVTVIDKLVSIFDNTINGGMPGLGIAWELTKGLYGSSIQLRQERALEFVEMIMNNPDVFNKSVLQSEDFQDSFVYTFERYLTQRFQEKRIFIQEIFIGLAKEDTRSEYKLERFISTVELISLEEVKIFRLFINGSLKEWQRKQYPHLSEEQLENAKSGPLNEVQIGMASKGFYNRAQLKNESEILDSLLSLNTLGLLIGDTRKLGMPYGGRFVITGYGQEFSKFIQNSQHDL